MDEAKQEQLKAKGWKVGLSQNSLISHPRKLR